MCNKSSHTIYYYSVTFQIQFQFCFRNRGINLSIPCRTATSFPRFFTNRHRNRHSYLKELQAGVMFISQLVLKHFESNQKHCITQLTVTIGPLTVIV